jgi:hypothetical protein
MGRRIGVPAWQRASPDVAGAADTPIRLLALIRLR